MKFGQLRNLVAKTDAISIMLKSIGDVDQNYYFIAQVPDKYNDYEVIGFGSVTAVPVNGDVLSHGTEFYLDDTLDN